MSAEKSEAIVLRIVEFSETSVIATLMTRDFGKITAMAKGARRRKSPFESALDLLAICRIVFLHKSSGAMDLLTEAKLERRFRSSSSSLDRLYAGYYVAELMRCLTDEHDPHPRAYELARSTLLALDAEAELVSTLFEFEVGLLTCLGHQPVFTKCAGCGRAKSENIRVSFGLNEGGVLCQKCRAGKQNIVSLSPEAWTCFHELNEFTARRLNETDGHSPTNGGWSRENQPVGEVRRVLNQYITHLLGFKPRLHPYITAIK